MEPLRPSTVLPAPPWRVVMRYLVVAVWVGLGIRSAPAVSVQPGWPQSTGFVVESSPALGDLDGDADLELVVGSDDGSLYAWHADGTPVAGWPRATGSVYGGVTLGDVDGSGDLEVVAVAGDGRVWVLGGDGIALTGWPKMAGGGDITAPALGDLDRDGDLEIVVSSFDGNVYAWHHDGTPVAGWPTATGSNVDSSPALGDIDEDGALEVVVGSDDFRVYAWHGDGTLVSGWPRATGGGVVSTPALADLDDDGHLEVVVGSADGSVYAWHGDGTGLTGWPRVTAPVRSVYSSPAVGDLDGDGDPEVVVGSEGMQVHAWHADGTVLTGWPTVVWGTAGSSPALSDLDGDGVLEVAIGSDNGEQYVFNGDGTVVAGWPQLTWDAITSSPAAGDLDADGDPEVVVGSWDYGVYAWSCDAPAPSALPWPMFHRDMRNTGVYGGYADFSATPTAGDAPLSVTFTDLSSLSASSRLWDFGDGSTSTQVHPTYVYLGGGIYDIALTINYTGGTDTETKVGYVSVHGLNLTVDPPSANPVASGGMVGLGAEATDSLGHAVTYAWSDGGAGGSFSDPTATHCSYTAPANLTDFDLVITLTVTATCSGASSGSTSVSRTGTTTLTVRTLPHAISLRAGRPRPDLVAPGATTSLAATATDTRPTHVISWLWSDGGAGGSFSNPTSPNPTYTTPPVPAGVDDLAVVLTVTATCNGAAPVSATSSVVLIVHAPGYRLSLTGNGVGQVKVTTSSATATHDLPWSERLAEGSSATLEAVPGVAWTFEGWWGDLEGTVNPASVVMSSHRHITADFGLPPGTAYWYPLDDPATELAGWTGWAVTPGTGWEYGAPVAGAGQAIGDGGAMLGVDPSTAHTGNRVIGYAIGGNYQRNLPPQYLVTPPLNFSGRTNVRLSFWRWLAVEDQVYDTAAIEIDAGDGWKPVWKNPAGSPVISTFDAAWAHVEYPLPQADGKSNVRIRWTMGPTDNWSPPAGKPGSEYGGWSLDDIAFFSDRNAWAATDTDLPAFLQWDQTADFSLTLENTGETSWDESYALASASDDVATDRWGTDPIPVSGSIDPGESYAFSGQVTAPPLSTLRYPAPVGGDSPGRGGSLSCDWQLSQKGMGLIGPAARGRDVGLSRFPDIGPGSAGEWAWFWIEELAGATPFIVQGFPNGTYRPLMTVDRAAIAVYIQRAARVPSSAAGTTLGDLFHDVPADHWAVMPIEALAGVGLVTGYSDHSYHPSSVVTRDQMCKFIVNGVNYARPGAIIVPDLATLDQDTYPFADVVAEDDPDTTDVNEQNPLANYVLAAAGADVVEGYPVPAGSPVGTKPSFHPEYNITRDQLSVFVWRGFLRDSDVAVVLGGPAVSVTAPTAEAYAVAGLGTCEVGDPVQASVLLDAVRAGTSPLSVHFELRRVIPPAHSGELETEIVASTYDTSLDADSVTAAHVEARLNGVPYLPAAATIDTTPLVPGTYRLVTSVNGAELSRRASFFVDALAVTAGTPSPAAVDSEGTTSLTASATDALGHTLAYAWSDGGAGGSFSNVNAANTTYTAPHNHTGSDRAITLTVTVTCASGSSRSASTTLTVHSVPHTLTLTVNPPSPAVIASEGTASLSATVVDSLEHTLTYAWSSSAGFGSLSDPAAANPTYTAHVNLSGSNRTVTLTLTVTCGGGLSKTGSTTLTILPE